MNGFTGVPIPSASGERRKCRSLSRNEATLGNWQGCASGEECTLHQVAPYIGKIKSSIARSLVSEFTSSGDIVCDPFCGSGSVALEAWLAGRRVIANDLNPYSVAVTRGKLHPPESLDRALAEIDLAATEVRTVSEQVDLRSIPAWVRGFFHPETLRETVAWFRVLKTRKCSFLLACLLGILHHQRPGFLSYPSSHAVPYLRANKFPQSDYPELYEYRAVQVRLEKKVTRAFSRIPQFDRKVYRRCYMRDARFLAPSRIDSLITSPPYMGQLDYARDNRLRLWFLGVTDHQQLDRRISPLQEEFLALLKTCFCRWRKALVTGGTCVLVLGDPKVKSYDMHLPDVAIQLATREAGGYSLVCRYSEAIPDQRRVRRGLGGSLEETIVVLRKERGR